MQTEEFVKILKRNNVTAFHVNDAAKILRKPKKYVALFLHRAVKQNAIMRAEKGLYYPARGTNEYMIASAVLSPSYISMISALYYYGLTTQIPNIVYVLSTLRHRPINNILGYNIIFKHIKKSMLFGYHREANSNIMMADPEKALVDIFYFNDVNDLDPDALEKPPRIDVAKLASYAVRSDSLNVMRKTLNLLLNYHYQKETKKLEEAIKRFNHD